MNVWGGPRSSRAFQTLHAELVREGVSRDRLSTMPGPLIRGTFDRGQHFSHTCLDPKSTTKDMGDMQWLAYEEVKGRVGVDPELELEGRKVPYFVNHANRRLHLGSRWRRGATSSSD